MSAEIPATPAGCANVLNKLGLFGWQIGKNKVMHKLMLFINISTVYWCCCVNIGLRLWEILKRMLRCYYCATCYL